jgi:prevent-host-death family protein
MTESRVGIRDLKNNLNEHLGRVKAGETIIITN